MSQADWDHIESYKQAFIDGQAIADIWSADDVQMVLEQQQDMDKPPKYLLGKELTDKDIQEILYTVQARFDAEEGINWYQIQYRLDEHFEGGER
jgi:glutathionyl-hydroquinone reductase